jgi:hypothetical protein
MKGTQKFVFACLAAMLAAALASYPLGMIGLEPLPGWSSLPQC